MHITSESHNTLLIWNMHMHPAQGMN